MRITLARCNKLGVSGSCIVAYMLRKRWKKWNLLTPTHQINGPKIGPAYQVAIQQNMGVLAASHHFIGCEYMLEYTKYFFKGTSWDIQVTS